MTTIAQDSNLSSCPEAEIEPPEPRHRIQRRPLPQSAPVITAARARRQSWLEAMRSVSQSSLSEHERETRQELVLDNSESED